MIFLYMSNKEGETMKKKLLVLLTLLTLGVVIPAGHVHDENCGYNPETGEGCVYEITLMQEEDFGN